MKQVFLISMSLDEKTTEDKINEAIYMIGKDISVTWLTELIKPLDGSKYMLVAEKEESTSVSFSPNIFEFISIFSLLLKQSSFFLLQFGKLS